MAASHLLCERTFFFLFAFLVHNTLVFFSRLFFFAHSFSFLRLCFAQSSSSSSLLFFFSLPSEQRRKKNTHTTEKTVKRMCPVQIALNRTESYLFNEPNVFVSFLATFLP